jgi:ribosomal protein S1
MKKPPEKMERTSKVHSICIEGKVGDIIEVKILKIEPERGRVSLGWAKPLD